VSSRSDGLVAALADRYRIERELGAGGMATVYLAEDLKHRRRVALKVLKPELAAVLGAERFVQEITTTAALQHPHILPLFDSGEADGFLFYVMPFIDGETLRSKLDRETQLGVEEAVRLACDVADALDYAHSCGVIHRDIKPENILLANGRPMVADFGIALAVSAAAGGRMTETGLSLGTPHYMSPEQATAEKEIGPRSDVYSLASVLYEMLAGQPPHLGGSAQQIIMKIITETPQPVTTLRKSVPPNVAAALAQALEKLPADRFTSAAKFADALLDRAFRAADGNVSAAATRSAGASRRAFAYAAGTAAVFFLLALGAWLRPGPAPAPLIRYVDGQLSESLLIIPGGSLAISPDGRVLAYATEVPATGGTLQRTWQLSVRDRDGMASRSLAGTEGGTSIAFSPDGKRLVFCQMDRQCAWRVVTLADGVPVTLAAQAGNPRGSAWSDDGYIYIGGVSPGLSRVPETGGYFADFTTVDTARGEILHGLPAALPKGAGVLFSVILRGAAATRQLAIADPTGAHRLLGVVGNRVKYAGAGHILYVTSDGTLMVVPFDVRRLTVTGEPRVVAAGVADEAFHTSETGTLLYNTGSVTGGPDELVWVDRNGSERPTERWVADFADLALSPDGSRLVVGIREQGVVELWVREGESGPISRLTFRADGQSTHPAWTPDGREVAYLVRRDAGPPGISIRRADGSTPAAALLSWDQPIREFAWTPDRSLVLVASNPLNLYGWRPGAGDAPRKLVREPSDALLPAISPDGRWLAYVSTESGRHEVYVRPLADPEASRTRVSSRGGTKPGWSRSGREILYPRRLGTGGEMVSVEVLPGPAFTVGSERVLFTHDRVIDYWGATSDGSRFVLVRSAHTDRSTRRVVVVENWSPVKP
jgi:eukaryotic-like serine/threonine-protein kinase